MALASALLKRLFVHNTLGLAWRDITFRRRHDAVHGKPSAILPSGEPAPVEFNISHQAGLVALVGYKTYGRRRDGSSAADVGVEVEAKMKADVDPEVELGVDIVCVNERGGDLQNIQDQGFSAWVDTYTDVFGAQEIFDIKFTAPHFTLQHQDGTGGLPVTPDMLGRYDRCCTRGEIITVTLTDGTQRTLRSDALIDAKLRRFYAYWCYKEAFVKLDGEALLATWIQRLEFHNVRAPEPASAGESCGERVCDAEVWFTGAKKGGQGPRGVVAGEGQSVRLENTRVQIVGFEEKFMIAVAARGVGEEDVLTGFKVLDFEREVWGVARRA